MKQQITMNTSQNLSIEEAYQLFIRKANIRNLSEQTIQTYNNHFKIFSNSIDTSIPISTVTIDTVDNYMLYLRGSKKPMM